MQLPQEFQCVFQNLQMATTIFQEWEKVCAAGLLRPDLLKWIRLYPHICSLPSVHWVQLCSKAYNSCGRRCQGKEILMSPEQRPASRQTFVQHTLPSPQWRPDCKYQWWQQTLLIFKHPLSLQNEKRWPAEQDRDQFIAKDVNFSQAACGIQNVRKHFIKGFVSPQTQKYTPPGRITWDNWKNMPPVSEFPQRWNWSYQNLLQNM